MEENHTDEQKKRKENKQEEENGGEEDESKWPADKARVSMTQNERPILIQLPQSFTLKNGSAERASTRLTYKRPPRALEMSREGKRVTEIINR